MARTGAAVGTVVNYLHPSDTAYEFSGHCLCSPCLVRLDNGNLLASMDIFNGGAPQNLTLIFESDDDGKTWHYISEEESINFRKTTRPHLITNSRLTAEDMFVLCS